MGVRVGHCAIGMRTPPTLIRGSREKKHLNRIRLRCARPPCPPEWQDTDKTLRTGFEPVRELPIDF